jgi:hypothetical protein
MRSPFTLYKEKTKTGLVWYARFWDETSRKYALSRSLGVPVEGKRERRREAEEAARSMLPGISLIPEAPDMPFAKYVADFWLPDSPYVRECATVKKKPLSAFYLRVNTANVKLHIEPFSGFQGITLRKLTAGNIRDWQTWAAAQGSSGRTINSVLSTMRVAVHYAVSREELDLDPFQNIGDAANTPKEKGVLSFDEVTRLIHTPVSDPCSRLAVLLGLLCGMRRGQGIYRGQVKRQRFEGKGLCRAGAAAAYQFSVPVAFLPGLRAQKVYGQEPQIGQIAQQPPELYGPGKAHAHPYGRPFRRIFPQVQGVLYRTVNPDGFYFADPHTAAQNAGVKNIANGFVQHLEQVDGPLVPAGEGLTRFIGFKKDEVHYRSLC